MSTYCVYLTIYRGKKLPIFYIGSSSIAKIKNGYHGSVSSKEYGKIWKEELRNNPELFRTRIISSHDTREQAFDKEERIQKKLNVIKNSLYINKAFANAKFSLKQHSSWTRDKFKTRVPWNKGKTDIYSSVTLDKMSSARIGKGHPCSEVTKNKLSVPNPLKGLAGKKNGMYGKTHTDLVKTKLGEEASLRFKGKSYEELYGKDKAEILKKKRSDNLKEKDNSFKNNPRFDNNEYTFFNVETGVIVNCTRWVLIHNYGVQKSAACGIINQGSVSQGWCILFV